MPKQLLIVKICPPDRFCRVQNLPTSSVELICPITELHFRQILSTDFMNRFTFSALVASPKKLLHTVANPARGLLNRGKKKKKKVWHAPPPAARSEKKKKKKITRRIHMSRRYASRRHAGGLGPSRISTRIPTTRRLGQWVSLRKILRFRLRL